MILVEFDLYAQKWGVSRLGMDHQGYFDTKDDAIASVSKYTTGTHIVVRDPRFARHPVLRNKYISRAGAETFHQMYGERWITRKTGAEAPLAFEDWANAYLDTNITE